MYDGGITYKSGRWTAEAEYLYKHYTKDAFRDVNAFDGFICYDLPLKKIFSKISFLGRFDYMGDHSDGTADEKRAPHTDRRRTQAHHRRHHAKHRQTVHLGHPYQL